ncbi:MAG TPA: hypothetical protein PK268_04595 [Enterococcus sp.]|jgi:phage terminase Nu1 subunit (DNA packaging protein)|nr:hypothetical protein [Enterococcus sp.]HPR81165.1 hypothetical protein [Enterococcus sp.]
MYQEEIARSEAALRFLENKYEDVSLEDTLNDLDDAENVEEYTLTSEDAALVMKVDKATGGDSKFPLDP